MRWRRILWAAGQLGMDTYDIVVVNGSERFAIGNLLRGQDTEFGRNERNFGRKDIRICWQCDALEIHKKEGEKPNAMLTSGRSVQRYLCC